jgi:hypothetical protein
MNDSHDIESPQQPRQVWEKNMHEVVKKFYEPTFLDFDLRLNNLHALFKPWPRQTEYLRITSPKAIITNRPYRSSKRFCTEFHASPLPEPFLNDVWCESYLIVVE